MCLQCIPASTLLHHLMAPLVAGYQVAFDYTTVEKGVTELLYDITNELRVRDGWCVMARDMAEYIYSTYRVICGLAVAWKRPAAP